MITYRKMEESDVGRVYEIECEVFSTPWSKQSFYGELQNDKASYYVAVKNNQVIGYAGLWKILDEGHVTNIAINKKYRGQKIGTSLMKAIMEATKEKGINTFTLEVRVSNALAIALYKKLGFEIVGKRKNYYEHPTEDAIIMWTPR